LWDAESGDLLHTLRRHTDEIRAFSFSPDGRNVASASGDKTLAVWEMETGRCLTILRGHTEPVYACAYSPSGKRLVSASIDESLILWDIASGEEIAEVRGYTGALLSCALSPDGGSVVYGNQPGNVALVSIENLEAFPPFVKAYARSRRLYSQCPFCRKKLRIRDSDLGERTHCSRCKKPIRITPFLG
jgi:WD40 repeat protein